MRKTRNVFDVEMDLQTLVIFQYHLKTMHISSVETKNSQEQLISSIYSPALIIEFIKNAKIKKWGLNILICS